MKDFDCFVLGVNLISFFLASLFCVLEIEMWITVWVAPLLSIIFSAPLWKSYPKEISEDKLSIFLAPFISAIFCCTLINCL